MIDETNLGEMIMFIKQVKEQLGKMSEAEKEEWILAQAKLLEENEQQSFLMSLSGEKKLYTCQVRERSKNYVRR